MELWVALTIAAAFFQNARSAMQQRLKQALGTAGGGVAATFTRFVYAAPFAALFFAASATLQGGEALRAGLSLGSAPAWAGWTALAATAQIGATWALLRSFDFADFTIGTAVSKTEPLLAAAFGITLLGEAPTALSAAGLALGVLGVAAATLEPAALDRPSGSRPGGAIGLCMLWGAVAAAAFALSAVGYRAASLSLDGGSAMFRASATLLLATLMQAFGMGLWMRLKRPSALAAVWRAWRPGAAIGAAGAAASAGWFWAMTLEPAAHVRALGQVELVFALIAGALLFGERLGARKIGGVLLIGVGAALLLLGAA